MNSQFFLNSQAVWGLSLLPENRQADESSFAHMVRGLNRALDQRFSNFELRHVRHWVALVKSPISGTAQLSRLVSVSTGSPEKMFESHCSRSLLSNRSVGNTACSSCPQGKGIQNELALL